MPPGALTVLQRSLRTLDYTRTRMERLYQDRKIAERDLHTVYESLFLRAVTSFESFLEELFIAVLERRVTYKQARKVCVRVTTNTRQALMSVLLQDRDYLSWLPFSNTERRATIYLTGGRPFTGLDDSDKSMVKTITTIRNAIAHRSKYAMDEFDRTVIGSRTLLRGERRPAGFLRSNVGTAHNQFQVYVGELARIAAILCY